MLKRSLLFLITHVLVITTILVTLTLTGLYPYLALHRITYPIIIGFCFSWGTIGSCLALLTARMSVEIQTRVKTLEELSLLEQVYALAYQANLNTMPTMGVYSSPELNAYVVGPSKKQALIAVSSSLLSNMNRQEMEAILGHAITEIANGDGITRTLCQGIINSFSLFLTRIAFGIISMVLPRNKNISALIYSLLTLVFDILFTLLGSLVVIAFSRRLIYRADRGGAQLAGLNNMIAALERLRSAIELEDERAPSVDAFKITHQLNWGIELLSSHPSLIKRINRLVYHANSTH